MATPPTSGGLFFSSSPERSNNYDLEEHVRSAFDKAQRMTIINPEVKEIFSQHKTVVNTFLERHIQLIASRSHDWKDGQVTIFDKVLLMLAQDGKGMNSSAVLNYFCKEFLGIFDQVNKDEKRTTSRDPFTPSRVPSPSTARLASFSESFETNYHPQETGSIRKERSITDKQSETISKLASELEPITGRLWTVYAAAKHELAESNESRKKKAAKFLRDTAENLLYRLRDMSVDERLTEEVATTLQTATVMTTLLHGGNKRKFDESPESSDRSRPTNTHSTKRIGHQDGARYEKRHLRKNSGEVFLGRSRSVDRYRYKNRERNWGERGNGTGHNSRNGQHRKIKGRGPSGIPYGYTRPVDSYYPD